MMSRKLEGVPENSSEIEARLRFSLGWSSGGLGVDDRPSIKRMGEHRIYLYFCLSIFELLVLRTSELLRNYILLSDSARVIQAPLAGLKGILTDKEDVEGGGPPFVGFLRDAEIATAHNARKIPNSAFSDRPRLVIPNAPQMQ